MHHRLGRTVVPLDLESRSRHSPDGDFRPLGPFGRRGGDLRLLPAGSATPRVVEISQKPANRTVTAVAAYCAAALASEEVQMRSDFFQQLLPMAVVSLRCAP